MFEEIDITLIEKILLFAVVVSPLLVLIMRAYVFTLRAAVTKWPRGPLRGLTTTIVFFAFIPIIVSPWALPLALPEIPQYINKSNAFFAFYMVLYVAMYIPAFRYWGKNRKGL